MQEALQDQLTEEELRRNSRRQDLVYVLSSHPLAPDAYEVAEASSQDAQGKDLDAAAVGERPPVPGGVHLLHDWLCVCRRIAASEDGRGQSLDAGAVEGQAPVLWQTLLTMAATGVRSCSFCPCNMHILLCWMHLHWLWHGHDTLSGMPLSLKQGALQAA